MSEHFRDDHSILLDLFRATVTNAGKTSVTLCGGLTAEREALVRVLMAGVNALSIASSSTASIREAERHLESS